MKIQINKQSPQWSKVDYKVQLSTGKSSVKIINIYKYTQDPNQQSQYIGIHGFSGSSNTTSGQYQAIINITDFSKQYQSQLLAKTIPLQDVIFYCGHVNIHKYSQQQRFKVFTFLLCKINLGRIGYPKKDDVTKCQSILIPQQYQNQQQALQYNFFLRTHNQYQIMYQISFTLTDDQKQFKLSDYQCSSCQNRIPTIYCKNQNLYFCQDCCTDHHKKRIMSNHQLQSIDKINTLGICKTHMGFKIDSFCLKCQKYLCQQCKQKGAHHQNFQHPIKTIDYYYQQTRQNIQTLPRKYKDKVDQLLFNLGIKRKQIQTNHIQVKTFLINKHQQLIKQLDNITQEKIQTLNSCEIQLKMINDKLQWSKAFAKFQDKSLKPLEYFHSQKMFQEQLQKMKLSEFQAIFTIKADIDTQGDLKVGTRDTLQRQRYKKAVLNGNNSNTYFSPKGRNAGDPNDSELQHQTLLSKKLADQQSLLLHYNKNSAMPKKGDLTLLIQNSNFKFFQVSAK